MSTFEFTTNKATNWQRIQPGNELYHWAEHCFDGNDMRSQIDAMRLRVLSHAREVRFKNIQIKQQRRRR